MEIVKEEAFAGTTNRTRRSQWKKYREFTERWNLQYIPIVPHNVCRFLYEASEDLCYNSLNNYVSGLNLLSKLNDDDDLRQDFGIHLMLMGLKRLKGDTVTPKEPLLPEDLRKIFQQINLENHTDLSIWLGILFCFRTLLRKCHVFTSQDTEVHLLSRHNVKFEPWGLLVLVPTSKTNQFRQKTFEAPVTRSNSDLCLVSQIQMYWAGFGGTKSWPVVSHRDGRPISYSLALRTLKKWCKGAGIIKDVGFHSLRRGAASHMYSLGVPIHDIKIEGDWQSMAVLLYLSTSMSHRVEIDKKVSEALGHQYV